MAAMNSIIIFAASNTHNLALATQLSEEATQQGVSSTLINIINLNLPLYTPIEQKKGIPASIPLLITELKSVNRFAFITPEYNGGIAPSLTNLIAWISVCSDDWRDCFNGKTAIIGTHSGSGGLHALMQLRSQLAYIGLNVLGRQLHTHYKKPLEAESLSAIVKALLS
jgi:chromate reductase, NAD(P)H dehydrogenase (quinone)